jgi:hypothetical protein
MFVSVPVSLQRVHRDACGGWGNVMSWKDVVWICLIVGVVILASVARHFVRDILFIVEHIIASGLAYAPGFLHFVSALMR